MKINNIMSRTLLIGTMAASCFSVSALADINTAEMNVNTESSVSQENTWIKALSFKNDIYLLANTVEQAKGTVNANNVNIRAAASSESKVMAMVKKGDTVTVVGQNSVWYKIIRTNGETAYISKSFVSGADIDKVAVFDEVAAEAPAQSAVESTQPVESGSYYGVVTVSGGLNLRKEASTSAEKIQMLGNGEFLDVLETGSEWIKVKTESGNTGYVSAEFVSVRSGEKPSRSIASSAEGEQIVAFAKQYIGTPYVWGGTDLENGVDCSGFVYSVFKNFGITLNRSSASMASNGVAIEKSALQPGDIILFDTTGVNDGGISHAGIYVGNNQYIHATSGAAYSVVISELNNDYGLRTYVTARRVLR